MALVVAVKCFLASMTSLYAVDGANDTWDAWFAHAGKLDVHPKLCATLDAGTELTTGAGQSEDTLSVKRQALLVKHVGRHIQRVGSDVHHNGFKHICRQYRKPPQT